MWISLYYDLYLISHQVLRIFLYNVPSLVLTPLVLQPYLSHIHSPSCRWPPVEEGSSQNVCLVSLLPPANHDGCKCCRMKFNFCNLEFRPKLLKTIWLSFLHPVWILSSSNSSTPMQSFALFSLSPRSWTHSPHLPCINLSKTFLSKPNLFAVFSKHQAYFFLWCFSSDQPTADYLLVMNSYSTAMQITHRLNGRALLYFKNYFVYNANFFGNKEP